MGANYGYKGTQDPASGASEFNALTFLISQMIARISTATLVQVVSVTNAGDLSPVGYVDVQPLVNQLDGSNNAVPHGVVHNLPYFRIQGGANAVIMDPQKGDVGIAVFADRDLSSVKATGKQANPGSRRRHDMADGLYFGGVLNGVPSQYVQFNADGIKMASPKAINLNAPNIELDAQTIVFSATDLQMKTQTLEINASASATVTTPTFTINGATTLNGPLSQGAGAQNSDTTASLIGPLNVTGDVTANGISVSGHEHGGVQPGGGTTGQPI